MKIKGLLLVFTLCLATACSHIKNVTTNVEMENKNYEIKEIKDGSNIKYNYIIYDNDHNEMDKGTTFRINPHITNIDKILQLCISEGTGLQNCKYYDTQEKKKSDWFETPILSNNQFVVRLNKLTKPTGIIVQNIFDKSQFYEEYDINFSDKEIWPIEKIKFINDNTIKITYISNDKEQIKTKIINFQ